MNFYEEVKSVYDPTKTSKGAENSLPSCLILSWWYSSHDMMDFHSAAGLPPNSSPISRGDMSIGSGAMEVPISDATSPQFVSYRFKRHIDQIGRDGTLDYESHRSVYPDNTRWHVCFCNQQGLLESGGIFRMNSLQLFEPQPLLNSPTSPLHRDSTSLPPWPQL